jgi:hypothetical protein
MGAPTDDATPREGAGRTLRNFQVCREEEGPGVAAMLKRLLAAQAAQIMEPGRAYWLQFTVGRAPLLRYAVAVELEVEPLCSCGGHDPPAP